MLVNDFNQWNSFEDAVFLKNKVMLAPEAVGSFGYLESTIANPIQETWVARIDFKIGRDRFKRKDWINGDGFAIHYLRTVR